MNRRRFISALVALAVSMEILSVPHHKSWDGVCDLKVNPRWVVNWGLIEESADFQIQEWRRKNT